MFTSLAKYGAAPYTDWFPFHKQSSPEMLLQKFWYLLCLFFHPKGGVYSARREFQGWFCEIFASILDCETSALPYSAFLPSNGRYFLDLVLEQIPSTKRRHHQKSAIQDTTRPSGIHRFKSESNQRVKLEPDILFLVGGLEHFLIFHILGISSSDWLSYFSEG